MVARVDSNADCGQQRQVPTDKPAQDSMAFGNDLGPFDSTNLPNSLEANTRFLSPELAPESQSSRPISSLDSSTSDLNPDGRVKQQSLASSTKQKSDLTGSTSSKPTINKIPAIHEAKGEEERNKTSVSVKRKSDLSAWHNSLSRMSSKLNLFNSHSHQAKHQQQQEGSGHKKSMKKSGVPIDGNEMMANNNNDNTTTTSDSNADSQQQANSLSVAESMKLGVDTWIECKVVSSGPSNC